MLKVLAIVGLAAIATVPTAAAVAAYVAQSVVIASTPHDADGLPVASFTKAKGHKKH